MDIPPPNPDEFVIPKPYRGWCHVCKQGFMTVEETVKHNHENLNKHQQAWEEAHGPSKASKKSKS
jgi:hypothetical protein